MDNQRLKAQLAGLSPEQRQALLQKIQKIKGKTKGSDLDRAIGTYPRGESIALSFAQQRLWFLDQLEGQNPSYNMPAMFELKGDLNRCALSSALNDIISRHEILRTTLHTMDGQGQQKISPQLEAPITWLDLSVLSDKDQEERIQALMATEFQHQFVLDQLPLFRILVIKQQSQQHRLLLTLHHVIFDGWSVGVLSKELSMLYAFHTGHSTAQLEPLPIQYADFAQWQREYLSDERIETQLSFWRDALQDAPALELPLDFPRPAALNFEGAREPIRLPLRLSNDLQRLSREQGVTVFTVLFAAFVVVCARHSGQSDIVVGTPAANRDHRELEPLIGFFVNSLVLRTDLSGNPSFVTLLSLLQRNLRDIWQHQSLPFEQLVDELNVPRQKELTPLFQHMFVWQGEDQLIMEMEGLEVNPLTPRLDVAKFDLTMTLGEKSGEIIGDIEYRTACYKAETMQRFIQHFCRILESAVREPNRKLSELEFLSEAEIKQLNDFNSPDRNTQWAVQNIAERFEQQAALFPDNVALVFEQTRLSYTQVNSKANQLARYLLTQGLGPGKWAALRMSPSLDLIITILALLKTGTAYLPLDPSSAAERNRLILEDAQVDLCLCDMDHEDFSQNWLNLSNHKEEIAESLSNNLNLGFDANAAAYMIYTSGTTGRPKGVVINHFHVLRLFSQSETHYHFNENDAWLLFHSFAFDVSVWEMWGALFFGAKLVVLPSWLSRDPEKLLALIKAETITVLNQTPSAFKQLLTVENEREMEALPLRYIIFAGEVLNYAMLKPWVKRHGFNSPELINMYGITETTVHVTWHRISEQDMLDSRSCIGRPLADMQIVLLDEYYKQVPLGTIGEMYVSGEGLSDGYWQRPELTAARFITKQISGLPEKRLYKSGDLAFYTPSGSLIYVGRNDEQLKIRGYRIEPGEVGSIIKQLQGVTDAAVIADEDNKYLLAFVVLSDEIVSKKEIRKGSVGKLPLYMQPAFYYFLDNLPVNNNGKLDKKQLLTVHESGKKNQNDLNISLASERVSARNTDERKLVEIWQEVLGLEWVGIFDNFFELGGDSILSLQIVSRAKKAGLAITARHVFDYQTIAELADISKTSQLEVLAQQGAVEGEQLLIPIQKWFFKQVDEGLIVELHHWNQSLLFNLKKKIELEQLKLAWQIIIAQHDNLRCHFVESDSGWGACYDKKINIDRLVFEQVCTESELAFHLDSYQTELHIKQGPLQKIVLIRCDNKDYLFITIHHLLIDGVSWRIVMDDLQNLLSHGAQVSDDLLGNKTTSFQQSSHFVNEGFLQGCFDEQVEYWQRHCQSRVVELPACIEKLPIKNDEFSIAEQKVSLDEIETSQLLRQSHAAFNTEVNELLITALLLAVNQWYHSDLIRLDLESHGRDTGFDNLDLSRSVGWYTSLYPQIFNVSEADSLAETILLVKEQLRKIPLSGYAYGWLCADKKNGLSAGASSDILFNYLGQVDQSSSTWFDLNTSLHSRDVSARNKPAYPLEINVVVQGGQLLVNCHYDSSRFSSEQINSFLGNYSENIRQIIFTCTDVENYKYSPSDFPLLTLSEEQFDPLVTQLSSADQRRDLEAIYPLSPMQEGMLFHSLLDESGETYFEQIYIELRGGLDASVLDKAWQCTQARHAVLRTGFVWEDLPRPLQFVKSHIRNPLTLYSVGGLDADATDMSAVEHCLLREREEGFNLNHPGLMRLGLYRSGPQHNYLVLNFHHLILDGWSVPIVLADLFGFYIDFTRDQDVLPAPGPRYEPFISYLEGEDKRAARDFWIRQLADFDGATALPMQSLNTASLKAQSAECNDYLTCSRSLSSTLTQQLEAFSKRHHLTLNTLFQAAWSFLLSRYAGDGCITFGSTVAGRPSSLPHIEKTAGMFINTLPFTVQVPSGEMNEDDLTVVQWLEKIQQQHLLMRGFESTPLSELQQLCGLEGGEALFESILVFENYPVDKALSANDLPLSVGEVSAVWKTNFPLTLIFVPGETINIKLSYQRVLYDETKVQKLLSQLQQVLECFLTHADQAVQRINLLTKDEQVRMLYIWNQSEAVYPSESNIIEQFDLVAAGAPAAVALQNAEGVLSYALLQSRANQFSHYLIEQGVGEGSVVGFCGERAINTLVSLLAILKTGAAYLPLDPNYPTERIRYMLEDSGVQYLVCQPAVRERLRGTALQLIDWGEDVSAYPDTAPLLRIRPDQLALLIYTSGSTGQPKGIELTHRNVVNLVKNTKVNAFNADEVLLHYAPIAFDAATFEIWGGLLNGLRLVLAPPGHLDPEQFGEVITQYRITTLFLTTALFHTLVEYNLEAFAPLQVVMTGGEVVDPERVKTLLAAYPALRFVNLYGPSENTTLTTAYSPANAAEVKGALPIGYPVSNTQVYVLDNNLQPLQVGMVGELCIAGDGLARGYRCKPALTAQAFVENPFAAKYGHGPRLYHSGDLARYRDDGAIEFMGRRDRQVKIRGHRIELAEVETAIRQVSIHFNGQDHPVVRDVVVLVRKTAQRNQLIAWCVLNKGSGLASLKAAAAELLPSYMLPSQWQTLDEIPLTANGKIDRRALCAPCLDKVPQVMPKTVVETALVEIWSQLLGVEAVGIHDNFFALGGDSILTIQVVSRAKRAGIRITAKQLFEQQTIAELAQVAGEVQTIIAQQGEVVEVAHLTPIQHWFFQQAYSYPQQWNMSLLLQPASADMEGFSEQLIARIRLAVQAVVAQHDMLRSIFPDGRHAYLPLDWTHPQLQQMFQVEDLHEQQVSLAESLNAAQASLDLEKGPLFKVLYLRAAEGERLLILAHHLIIDGVSWRILLEDLELACGQQLKGEMIDLGRKTTAFTHWSQGLWQFAQQPGVQTQLAYWQRLRHCTVSRLKPELGLSGGEVLNMVADTRSIQLRLSAAKTEQLLRHAPHAYRTEISDLLLTALLVTLNEISREQGELINAHLIALEGHGREHLADELDTSRTVAWFTTMFPVLLSTDAVSWDQRIKAIKQQLREIPQHGLGFGLLRYQSAFEIEAGMALSEDVEGWFAGMPQPQISFNYLGQTADLFKAGSLFVPAAESPGNERHLQAEQASLIDIAGIILQGEEGPQLQMQWRWSKALFKEETIHHWAERYQQQLNELIDYCCDKRHSGAVPADFPLAQLDQVALDKLLPDARQIEDIYPLSPLQEGLWFHHKMRAGPALYFEQHVVKLVGELNVLVLQQAWQNLVDRHSILRSAFVEVGERPLQVVYKRVKVPFAHLSSEHVELENFLEQDRNQGFEFEQAPLMRVTVRSSVADQHDLIWSFHHILLDGWSVSLLLAELLQTYELWLNNVSVPALSAALPYRDFIQWLDEQNRTEAEQFWQDYLCGFAAATPLPGARTVAEVSIAGQLKPTLSEHLTVAASDALSSFCQARHITLNTLFQGAWAYLLAAYSAQDDVVFGITVAGRPPELSGIEQRVGLYINTQPVRVVMDVEQSIDDYLLSFQTQQNQGVAYEYLPLFTIQSQSKVRGELFQSLLVYENYPVSAGLDNAITSLKLKGTTSIEQTHYPLTVVVLPEAQLTLQMTYDCSRFSEQQIRRLLKQTLCLVEQLAAKTEADVPGRMADLSLLLPEDKNQILQHNHTRVDLPADGTILNFIQQQVLLQPLAPALSAQGDTVSYQSMNQQANQLAHYLLEKGLPCEGIVAVVAERGINSTIIMLAVFKAGGACLAIDAYYPRERINFMLTDVQPSFVLCEGAHLDSFAGPASASIVCIDDATKPWKACSENNPVLMIRQTQLAFIVYTSGSSGQPKGVQLEHGNLLNFCLWYKKHFALAAQHRHSVLAGFGFDALILEHWPALAAGASLHFVPEEAKFKPDLMMPWLAENGVTHCFMPTALVEPFFKIPLVGNLALKHLVTGGDRLVQRPLANMPYTVSNLYGPSEASVVSTVSVVRSEQEAVPAIGYPVDNAQIYLLDSQGRQVPPGIAGEIYIGGAGVARAYLYQGALSAEMFIRNNFTDKPGERLYVTGDMARYRENGELEFLGRRDQQIKIRGVRIELGEVEAALNRLPEIKQSVVTCVCFQQGADKGGRTEQRLAAYLIIAPGSGMAEGLDTQLLRRALSRHLPEAMIPTLFQSVSQFPLTANGKIDRKRLPPVALDSAMQEGVAPRNDLEIKIADIWQQVLGLERVGVYDDFFALGGHSLLATKVHTRLRENLSVEIPLRTLFEVTTVARLSELVSSLQKNASGEKLAVDMDAEDFDEGFL